MLHECCGCDLCSLQYVLSWGLTTTSKHPYGFSRYDYYNVVKMMLWWLTNSTLLLFALLDLRWLPACCYAGWRAFISLLSSTRTHYTPQTAEQQREGDWGCCCCSENPTKRNRFIREVSSHSTATIPYLWPAVTIRYDLLLVLITCSACGKYLLPVLGLIDSQRKQQELGGYCCCSMLLLFFFSTTVLGAALSAAAAGSEQS